MSDRTLDSIFGKPTECSRPNDKAEVFRANTLVWRMRARKLRKLLQQWEAEMFEGAHLLTNETIRSIEID